MTKTLSIEEVRDLATRALTANGASDENAAAVAGVVTSAELNACASHGLFRIPGYVSSLVNGRADGNAVPIVEDVAPGMVAVDAAGGFAPPAMRAGRSLLIEKTKAQGIAVLGIRGSYHFAAVWPDIEPLAEADLIAMGFVNSKSYIPPWGGRTPLYGTNPMAFACPRADGPPMCWDQASAALARGEIMIAARDGHLVPETAGLDADGKPNSDPDAILNGGVQLAFGGYKGASIAMMVEILAAGLTGGNFGYEVAEQDDFGGPSSCGECVIAIDPMRLGGDGFAWRVERFFARIVEDHEARLPGDRRIAARSRVEKGGTTIPLALYEKIAELAGGA